MIKAEYDIGMIGLGVMGRNFVLNMADHGFSIAGYDKDESKVTALENDAVDRKIFSASSLDDFLKALKKPRVVIFLVPAGPVVDSVIRELLPNLEAGDLLIDAGNSHFKDTDRRGDELHQKKILYIGMGVSGGEYGARFGPSIMPGGPQDAYYRVEDILKSVAAKAGGEPCVTYLGPRSAGHYVKMVHNGIEYGLIQLIAETYDLLKRGLRLSDDELHDVYASWNEGVLASFLIKIAADVFKKEDDTTGKRLIDVIEDAAKQKGTGKWTSQDAMDLGVPVPTIDAAVEARDISAYKSERVNAAKILTGPLPEIKEDRKTFIGHLMNAFHFAMISTYAQGMALLRKASQEYQYNLKLKDIASIWRDGCIIRSAFLEDIRAAYDQDAGPKNLMLNSDISEILIEKQNDIRKVIAAGVAAGIPVPAMAASLAYYDSYRTSRLPANLIQAQRDYFGAHTYERIDEKGTFHTEWSPA